MTTENVKTRQFSKRDRLVATFSIVAYDPESGDLGVAVQSKFLSSAAVPAWPCGAANCCCKRRCGRARYGPAGPISSGPTEARPWVSGHS